jgi:hypothetical protein
MKASHTVIVQPGDDIFTVVRRWKATKPAGASDCIFIRFNDSARRASTQRHRLAA